MRQNWATCLPLLNQTSNPYQIIRNDIFERVSSAESNTQDFYRTLDIKRLQFSFASRFLVDGIRECVQVLFSCEWMGSDGSVDHVIHKAFRPSSSGSRPQTQTLTDKVPSAGPNHLGGSRVKRRFPQIVHKKPHRVGRCNIVIGYRLIILGSILFIEIFGMLYNYRLKWDSPSPLDPFQHLISPRNNNQPQILPQKGVNIKKAAVVQRKEEKEKLAKEVREVISRINEDLEIEQCQDEVLRELYAIRRKVLNQNFQDIYELIQSAIGRRIYNVEAQKLRIKRKQIVCSWNVYHKTDRRTLISVYPYAKLMDQKFLEQTFLFTPYANGYAFNYASCKYSAIYPETFKEIRAQHTIKTINEIYLDPKELNQPLLDQVLEWLMKCGTYLTLVVFLYIAFQVSIFYLLPAGIVPKDVENRLMFAALTGPITLLASISLLIAGRQYFKKKESKTNFEKTVELVESYLAKINTKNREEAKQNFDKIQFRWEASKDLFYISVRVDKTIQTNLSWINLRR